ncbi:hypothetical protein BJY01DRAFT_199687 [Aspergillus pseudoustus]|uniref:Aspartic peptidase domain-containing protein n=1 Tax=Aspergillus pseudoustus TaxID=1810923 RepID=A0ABR4JSB9_9EURO
MTLSSRWMLLFATLASLASTQTNETEFCTPPYGTWGNAYVVDTQDVLDEIASHCTTVNGSVVMFANYTGAFSLPNVRNITGSLEWRSVLDDPNLPEEPSPTEIDVPDLEYVGSSVYMNSLPALRNFSAPKLRTVGWSVSIDYAVDVDLRALESAEYIQYTGNVSTLRLDSLREVRQRVFICNKDACSEGVTPNTAFKLSLPSLSVAGALELDGRYSALDMPQLANISGQDFAARGFRFATSGGEVINLTFPKLSYVRGEMTVNGGIGSFAMESMRNMSTGFTLITSEPLNVTIPFEEATYIDIYGNITGLRFPNLKSWEQLRIHSGVDLDCEATTESLANTTAYPYSCWHSEDSSSSSGLSTGAKAGIGVGACVAGILVVGLVAWLSVRRRKRAERLKSESNMHLEETPPTYGEARAQDLPPDYATTVSRD